MLILAVAAGSAVIVATSGSTVPPAGTGCQAADGKISGRGSLQEAVYRAFAAGFRDDVCGPVATDADAGTGMVAYNYPDAVRSGGTGSGAGQRAASCRTDAFATSDIPYTEAVLGSLNGAPGALGGCPTSLAPPFQPDQPPFPGPVDVQAPIMSFPVAGTSVAVLVGLRAADCGGKAPTRLDFTASMASRLFSGDIKNWSDPALRAGGVNAALARCDVPVNRVVRTERSLTTATLKNYLVRADNLRANATGCDVPGGTPTRWEVYATDANNALWPNTGSCSPLEQGASGVSALIAKCQSTVGAICYADLPDAVPSGLTIANLRNAVDTAYASPRKGTVANCDFSGMDLPGSTNDDAVGLKVTDNWGVDNNAVNGTGDHVNATFLGSKYPACQLTFALVYTRLANSYAANPIARLTADQRRTLYSYFLYVLSLGQDRLSSIYYAPLPAAWLAKLRAGFQANF